MSSWWRMSAVRSAMVAVALALVPSAALAQNAEIAGVVRDSSGGVLPGVTVEASSPALIEKVRVVTTDGAGQYRVIALVPGTYRVTFTLPGFSTVVREGVVLTAAFTANVDVALGVGAVQETVTVSGQTPLVDVEATTQRRALTAELLNELPTGRSFQNIAILVPGVQMPLTYSDVGGSDGARWQTMKVHGSRDDQMPLLINGMPFNNMNNSGGGYNHTLAINTGTVQEMTVTTSGANSEVRTSGVVANTVAKEGGNRFTYHFYGDFSNDGLQSDNLDDELRSRGLTAVDHVKELRELNPTMGGPIVADKLWFYGGFRYLRSTKYLANSFLSTNPLADVYCNNPAGCLFGYPTLGIPIGTATRVPDSRDLTRQDFSGDTYHRSYTANLTWQISERNKANLFYHLGRRNLLNDSSPTATPEASSYLYSAPDYLAQGSWTNPLTSRLLLEGGFTFFNETWWWLQREGMGIPIGNGPEFPVVRFEASSGALYGANFVNIRAYNHQYNMRFAANYVTGSHAFKVGMQNMWGTRNFSYWQNNSRFEIFFNGAPLSITQYAYPYTDLQKLKSALGIYAQDRWTIHNLTLSLGLRFDYHNAYVPEQDTLPGPFIAARHYDALTNTPNWKDISPRAGVAWDVRGDGKTVARFNYGHYVASESVATATANNPVNTRINSASRSWIDANLNYEPDCNLANTLANGECGALSAPIGNPNIVTRWDEGVLDAWGQRPSDDEILIGLQQQVGERLMLDAQWTRHWFGNLLATEYRATPTSAFDPFCVTAPSDSRLPGGGGNQICGFADVKPAFLGVTPDNFVTGADRFGKVVDVYTGVDLTATVRMGNGGQASGGVSVGRERTDFCDIATRAQIGTNTDTTAGKILLENYTGNSINNSGRTASGFPSTLYCAVTPPYKGDWKALISYPLVWGLNASATWQNRVGPQILANRTVATLPNTLGRAPTVASLSAALIEPGTMYSDRLNQIDVRLAKGFRVGGRARIQGTFSVFNLLNENSALTLNNTYGPSWLLPTKIMQGRLMKFGVQLDY
jgi:hypothetical protein